MGIRVDWNEFRIRLAMLKSCVRRWDHLFVIESPSGEAESRLAYIKHEATIKTLRNQIRIARNRCESLLVDSGVSSEIFGVGRPQSFVGRLSRDDQIKAIAMFAAYKAFHRADDIVRKSISASNYSFVSWDLLHVASDTRAAFIACREGIEKACWVLSDIQDEQERKAAAREESDTFEVDLPNSLPPEAVETSEPRNGALRENDPRRRETVSADDLAREFNASTRAIREHLKASLEPIIKGGNGKPYRFEKQRAVEVCEVKFTRKAAK